MRKADVSKIIFASSAAVYGYTKKTPISEEDPTLPTTIYGYHKLMAENEIKAYSISYGISYIILRLFNVYGGDPLTGKNVISIFIRNIWNNKRAVLWFIRKNFVECDIFTINVNMG